MKEDSVVSIEEPTTNKDVLTEVLREGAQKLLAEAVQAELEELLEEYREERSIEEPTTNKDVLTEVLREGAQKLLAEAVQAELEELLLRESYREAGKVRKRTLANLSQWPSKIVEGLRALLKGGERSVTGRAGSAWCATATCLGERSRRGLEGSRFGCLGFGIVGRARSLKRSFAFVLAWCRPI